MDKEKNDAKWTPVNFWGLISLLDMLEAYAEQYLDLGRQIQEAFIGFAFHEDRDTGPTQDELNNLKDCLKRMATSCEHLDLPVSKSLIRRSLQDVPKTGPEFQMLIHAISAELSERKFLYVPSHRASFYDIDFSAIKGAFPRASQELTRAGNALALGMYDAAVFHVMRAIEVGMRALATQLGVTFPHSIDLEQWRVILDNCSVKIKAIDQLPKSDQREQDKAFYGQAAAQFNHFNNGWRVLNAHGRVDFEESEAIKIFNHAEEFFETISKRLKEPS